MNAEIGGALIAAMCVGGHIAAGVIQGLYPKRDVIIIDVNGREVARATVERGR